MRVLLAGLLSIVAAAPALAQAPPPPSRADDFVIVGPPAVVERDRDALGPDWLYLNRCVGNCQVRAVPGVNDARANVSSIPDVDSTLTAFRYDDATWDAVVACVRDTYLPYGVEVVTTEPAPTAPAYVEVMVAGSPAEVQLDATTLGIAPTTGDCSPGINWIAFAFANVHGADPVLELCATVAHEAGHIYGLEHEFECTDPMTYLTGCGQKFFRNRAFPCGAFEQTATCMCGGTTQNTHNKLLNALGKGSDPPPPIVDIALPAAGATVVRGFSVFATAIDPRFVRRIELLVNGWPWVTIDGVDGRTSPYELPVPTQLPDGVMDLDVRACGELGPCATDRVRVTLGAPCTSEATCLPGQACDGEGRCAWPPPTGALGDACAYPQECLSNVCADIGGSLACTEPCFGPPNDDCPTGFSCTAEPGAAGVCAPEVIEESGCCAVGGTTGRDLATPLGLGLGVALLLVRRRRRRPAPRPRA